MPSHTLTHSRMSRKVPNASTRRGKLSSFKMGIGDSQMTVRHRNARLRRHKGLRHAVAQKLVLAAEVEDIGREKTR